MSVRTGGYIKFFTPPSVPENPVLGLRPRRSPARRLLIEQPRPHDPRAGGVFVSGLFCDLAAAKPLLLLVSLGEDGWVLAVLIAAISAHQLLRRAQGGHRPGASLRQEVRQAGCSGVVVTLKMRLGRLTAKLAWMLPRDQRIYWKWQQVGNFRESSGEGANSALRLNASSLCPIG